MEILLVAGVATLVGAYVSSRNSRDHELARQSKKALRDAKRANKRGDPQAAAYYMQVARDIAVQRLSEAEQRAITEAHQLQADGHPHRAEKKLAKAREIRATLVRDFQQSPHQPNPSLPIAVPPHNFEQQQQPQQNNHSRIAYPVIPPHPAYSPQLRSPQPNSAAHSSSSSPSYLPPAPRYEASASHPAPPADVRYYNQPPSTTTAAAPSYHVAAMPYPFIQQSSTPSIAPPPYVPSISSSPSSQPWVAPSKVH